MIKLKWIIVISLAQILLMMPLAKADQLETGTKVYTYTQEQIDALAEYKKDCDVARLNLSATERELDYCAKHKDCIVAFGKNRYLL